MSSHHRNLEPLGKWHATILIFKLLSGGVTFLRIPVANLPAQGPKGSTINHLGGMVKIKKELIRRVSREKIKINPHTTRQKDSHFYLVWGPHGPKKPKCVSLKVVRAGCIMRQKSIDAGKRFGVVED